MVAVISVALVGYFWIDNAYERFKNEEITLRQEYIDAQKSLIKNETNQVIDYIEFKISQAETRLKETIRNRAQEAYDIANIQFGDEGYIFAGQWDGLSLVGPAKGQNMSDVTDVNGVKIVRNFFGYSEADILGRNVIGTIVPPKDQSGFDMTKMIKDSGDHPERYVSNENENVRRNGERVRVAQR